MCSSAFFTRQVILFSAPPQRAPSRAPSQHAGSRARKFICTTCHQTRPAASSTLLYAARGPSVDPRPTSGDITQSLPLHYVAAFAYIPPAFPWPAIPLLLSRAVAADAPTRRPPASPSSNASPAAPLRPCGATARLLISPRNACGAASELSCPIPSYSPLGSPSSRGSTPHTCFSSLCAGPGILIHLAMISATAAAATRLGCSRPHSLAPHAPRLRERASVSDAFPGFREPAPVAFRTSLRIHPQRQLWQAATA
ncbi:hypothetical protein PYCCODRAFT_359654 [Trametes coccinea BRFM310]|uniref:Uncharacterized protein n=1 Tax=Trametes coccinea (strain BRFM310) TaxID=1353009 RepID=A0A1Y2J3E8_TRAC3|nr:hypothetical protein PYCCODRAFT_359654 [Trametes coccinea BRFM310]